MRCDLFRSVLNNIQDQLKKFLTVMEEAVFIKCEPDWSSETEELCNVNQDGQSSNNNVGNVKVELDHICPVEEETSDLVKEERGAQDVKEELICDDFGMTGSPQNELMTSFSSTSDINETIKENENKKFNGIGDAQSIPVQSVDPVSEHGERGLPSTTSSRIFANEQNMRIHSAAQVQQHHSCSTCGKSFARKSLVRQHMVIHKAITEQSPKCTHCGKIFNYQTKLNRHLLIHTGEKRYRCSICNKSFKQKCSLQLHISKHTKQLSCSICHKAFVTKSDLQDHLTIHSNGLSRFCKDCGKMFASPSDLQAHSRIHSRERVFPCSICGKTFQKNSHLLKHESRHSGERPYACSLCSKAYVDRASLCLHLKNHAGERDYKCLQCGKEFSTKYRLQRHMLTH